VLRLYDVLVKIARPVVLRSLACYVKIVRCAVFKNLAQSTLGSTEFNSVLRKKAF